MKYENPLTYEDCKELQEAGFPQEGYYVTSVEPGTCDCEAQKTHGLGVHDPQSHCIVSKPDLAELIEACGEKFGELKRTINEVHKTVDWYALSVPLNPPQFYYEYRSGSSPEQAVKNLWIVLNKK